MFSFSNCNNSHTYDKQIKELDSLKIVLQQSVSNFKTLDSAAIYEAYAKQYTYSSFINVNLKDTVKRSTADNLQTFYSIGKGMVNYLAMRPKWLEEANLSMKQLSDLSHDLKNGSVEVEEAVEFINEEKKEAEKIIEELTINTNVARSYMESYTKTLPSAEEVVKQLNKDALPVIERPVIKPQMEMD
jgi:replicative superfamily II helicase